MDTIGQRIKEARKKRGMSQAALAAHWGIARVSVTQWEADTTRPDADKIPGLIELFGGDADYWLGHDGVPPGPAEVARPSGRLKPNASPPVPVDWGNHKIAMRGHAAGGRAEDGRFILNGQKIMDVLCPPQLAGVPDAYGVFVHGDSMEPRYYPGEAVFVNPHQPVRQGDFVVVQVAGDFEGDDISGYVKRFRSQNSEEIVLEQFKRRDIEDDASEAERFTLRFPRNRVVAVHKIVATGIV